MLWVLVDPRDLLAKATVGLSTPAGEGPHAPPPKEHNLSIREELLEAVPMQKEVNQTICACQTHLNIWKAEVWVQQA